MKYQCIKFFSFICLVVIGFEVLHAQTVIRGHVYDETGFSLPGATVTLEEDPSIGTVTDLDGRYELTISEEDAFVLVFSYISFAKELITVQPSSDVVTLDVVLKSESIAIDEVKVIAKADRAADYYYEKIKQRSATTIDYISSQTIRRTGDSNVSGAVKRVTGVSSVDGFITVRGLADRYNLTTVDGLRIPTLDPFTNNIDLDIFPTGLVDNLVITKTGDPGLPSDWSGAFLSIETKDFPDRLSVRVNTSIGYNQQANLQNIISSASSATDPLGWDDGFRDIDPEVTTVVEDFPILYSGYGQLYDQFIELGYQDFMAQFGITEETSMTRGSDLHLLLLNQLGFLGFAEFDDPMAVEEAITSFEVQDGPQQQAFEELNQPLEDVGRSFNNTWFTERRRAPLNFSQSFSIGNQTKLFDKPLGFLVGLRYYNQVRNDPESRWGRSGTPADVVLGNEADTDSLLGLGNYDQQASRERFGWSALTKLSYKPDRDHSISLMFMPNILGENQARRFSGLAADDTDALEEGGDDQIYNESRQLVYQFHSTHRIPSLDLTLNADASYTDGQRNTLDFKTIQYRRRAENWEFDNAATPARTFRYLDEDQFDSRLMFTRPGRSDLGKKRLLRFGGAYQWSEREFQQVLYRLEGVQNAELSDDPDEFNQFLTLDRFIIDGDEADLYYTAQGTANSTDVGIRSVYSAFVSYDLELDRRWRIVGGLRLEDTDLLWDIREFFDENLADDDERRGVFRPSKIRSTDVLPSFNFIYKLRSEDTRTVNLRGGYFRSLARPGLREISPFPLIDFFLRDFVVGNPDLQLVDIHNLDFRWESYFGSGSSFSVSLFGKSIENHIELVFATGGFTWVNAEQSYVAGLEIEGRKELLKNLSIAGNISLIQSETEFEAPSASGELIIDRRPMFGQAPWILNGILTYQNDSIGFTASASYNVQGRKLAVVQRAEATFPDVYEMPRHLLDLKMNKQLSDHFSLSFGIRDILAAPIRRTYIFDEGYEVDFDRFTWGRTYNLGLTYQL